MADVIRGTFGARRDLKSGWARYEAQETGEPDSPDIDRPPDQDLPDPGEEQGDTPPDAPPFTGEDIEDVGPPRKRDRPTPM